MWFPLAWLLRLGLNPSTNLPLHPHFQLLPQSAIPASIPVFLQLFWAAIVSPCRRGPLAWSELSPSSHAGAITRGVAAQLCHGWKSLPFSWFKAWQKLLNISMKLPAVIDMQNNHFCILDMKLARQLICKITFNGLVACVPSPSSDLWG